MSVPNRTAWVLRGSIEERIDQGQFEYQSAEWYAELADRLTCVLDDLFLAGADARRTAPQPMTVEMIEHACRIYRRPSFKQLLRHRNRTTS